MDGTVGSLEGVPVGPGLAAINALNWPRKLAGELKPIWREMRSTGWDVVSSRYCDRRIRDRRSQRSGVVPVCSRKRRLSVRVLSLARTAMSWRVRSL